MNEKDLNIEYICEETLLEKDDELVPVILNLMQESYKTGLCQAEFDNTMNLIEENQELKKQLKSDYYIKGLEGTLKEYQQIMTKYDTQQKEFIKWLENGIEKVKNTEFLDERIQRAQLIAYNRCLRKYKKTIGDDK